MLSKHAHRILSIESTALRRSTAQSRVHTGRPEGLNQSLRVIIGRIRLGGFVEHFKIVEHISYSTGTSRNFVEHKICQ